MSQLQNHEKKSTRNFPDFFYRCFSEFGHEKDARGLKMQFQDFYLVKSFVR